MRIIDEIDEIEKIDEIDEIEKTDEIDEIEASRWACL